MRYRELVGGSTLLVRLVGVAGLSCCNAAFAAALPAADSAKCKINVGTLSVDINSLSSESNQQKLRDDLFKSVADPTFSRIDDLTLVEKRLARSAASWKQTDKTRLQGLLQDAMTAACNTLTADTAKTPNDALTAALQAVRFAPSPRSQYYLFLGSVESLQAQGGFASNVGADFLSRTTILGVHQPAGGDRGSGTLDGVFELSYAKIGAVASPSSSGSSTPPTPAQNAQSNPFTSATGILRGNLSAEGTIWGQYFGFAGGAGFSSRTNSSTQSSAHLSPRFFAGLLFLADYGASDNPGETTGRVLLGYAHDRFWQPEDSTDATTPNQPNRVFLDARIDMPGVFKAKSVKFSFSIFADAPMANHGPADVRFSLLISADLQSLLGITP